MHVYRRKQASDIEGPDTQIFCTATLRNTLKYWIYKTFAQAWRKKLVLLTIFLNLYYIVQDYMITS